MPTMLHEKELNFNEIEKIIFDTFCHAARELTKKILEAMDAEIARKRDKKAYRNKGKRTTTIKTRYGEVTYQRNVYQYEDEEGKHHKYLLDEELDIDKTGLISPELGKVVLEQALEKSFRQAAKSIGEMTGTNISAMAAWNVVQAYGEKAVENDRKLCDANKNGQLTGKVETPILFEEADGTYISLQGESRKGKVRGKGEIKISTTYTGWEKVGEKRYALQNRLVTAGYCSAKKFEEQRKARLASRYDMDGVVCRILNCDGSGWLKRLRTEDVIYQLDPFHVHKAIKEKIKARDAVEKIEKLLEGKKIEDVIEFIQMYADSVGSEKEYKNAMDLREYFNNNKDGLIPYEQRDLKLPKPKEGECYRHLGTMEAHVRSVICRRMKRNQSSWSCSGADHMSRLLALSSSGNIDEVITGSRVKFNDVKVLEVEGEIEITSAAKVEKSVGKGYEYPVKGHISLLDNVLRGSRAGLLAMAGF